MVSLPYLHTNNHRINAAFRIAMGDLVGNIQPFQDGMLETSQPCILAGLEYDTPWTRDTAINVWNGAGLIFPQAAYHTLLAVLEKRADGQVYIGGQYWDAIIWTTGAWAYYLYTGDRDFLALALEATRNALVYFEQTEFNPETGLFRGPACYGDGIAAYPDRYANTGGSSGILAWPECNPDGVASQGYGIPMQTLSTNCLYYNAYQLVRMMAQETGQPPDPTWQMKASALKTAINTHLWDAARGNYRYLVDPWGGCDHQEGLGSCFALLFGVADADQAQQILQNQFITNQGIPCVWPTFDRYKLTPDAFGRHSGTVWPHVQGFWADAAARMAVANPAASFAAQKFHFELYKLAELAVRDGMFAEIYHPISGAVYGGVQEGIPGWQWHSCRRQTWSATAYVRMVLMGLVGMEFAPHGITFQPLLPEGISHLELYNLPYRQQMLHITIEGQGSTITSVTHNGKKQPAAFLPVDGEGPQAIKIQVV